MSFRQTDMYAERQMAEYMDKKVYPTIRGAKWQRINDLNEQLKGVDGYLTIGEQKMIVDEKAQLYYINNNLQTFAFEINSIQKKFLTEGWLFGERYKTTYYMLIYPNTKNVTQDRTCLKTITSNDFANVNCLLIARNKIIDYLEKNGYSKEIINRKAEEMRLNNLYGKQPVKESSDFWFYFTEHLSEKPINIVIRKSILKKLSEQDITI